ncbi:MAG: histidinol-phosphate aminotransferase family protein, partial [Firmicutes bacterium]|nr:histidinol-phosphate aminotransferase family protein [Bacillota bacterium]
LRHALALVHGVGPDQVFPGNGAAELIRLLAVAFLSPGDRALVLEPTFGEYAVSCRLMGAAVVAYRATAERGFAPDVEEVLALIARHRPRLVFVCQPNNPTGHYLDRGEVSAILEAAPGLVALDEAYVNFVEDAWPSNSLLPAGNLVVLRSMTKDYALAGLRLGYAVAPPRVARALARAAPPWNVNALAQRAGVLALQSEGYLERSRSVVREALGILREGLKALGLRPLPSRANFFLVEVGDGRGFRQALLRRGILVRDCASFGLPSCVRIAARPPAECRRLLDAVAEVVRGRRPEAP